MSPINTLFSPLIDPPEIGIIQIATQPITITLTKDLLLIVPDLELFRNHKPTHKLHGVDNDGHVEAQFGQEVPEDCIDPESVTKNEVT